LAPGSHLISLVGFWDPVLEVDEPGEVADAIDLYDVVVGALDQEDVVLGLEEWKS
jgi:hypothetical protein